MTPNLLAAVVLAGCSGALLGGPFLPARPVSREREPGWNLAASPRWVGALAGLATWAFIGGPMGIVAGTAVAALTPVLLGRLEPAAARRRRAELTRAAPLVCDLMGAAMLSGVTLDRAVPVIARAFGGAVAEVLGQLSHRLGMGMDPAAAWSLLALEPGFGPLGRAAARSARTGSPLADLLLACGDELRAAATAQGLADIRTAGIKAVLPLGLCLLPAFVVLGIVPVVAGLIPAL